LRPRRHPAAGGDGRLRLRRPAGAHIADPPLVTSSRKFAGRRAPAIVAGWLIIHGLYHLGASPRLLWRLYYRHWHAGGADG